MAERTRLAEELERWLHRQRVSKAHVAKHGGVSGNTIWLIQQGTTTQPEIETLRKIARGLAVDPYSGELDRSTYAEAWRALALACGLPDPSLELGAPLGDMKKAPGGVIHRGLSRLTPAPLALGAPL